MSRWVSNMPEWADYMKRVEKEEGFEDLPEIFSKAIWDPWKYYVKLKNGEIIGFIRIIARDGDWLWVELQEGVDYDEVRGLWIRISEIEWITESDS